MNMNKWNFKSLRFLIISLIAVFHATPNLYAADIENNDALFNILPDNCLFCARINNFNESLGTLDRYLAGAAPVPVSLAMLVNMQLGAIIGDPTLSGIDHGGDFSVFAVMPQADQSEPLVGMLVPVENYSDFIESNPNCKEIENGLTLLSPPSSPMSPTRSMGNFLLAPAGDTYALVVPDEEKAVMPALQNALESDAKISERLSTEQTQNGISAPAWVYINLSSLYEKYNKDVLGMLEIAKMGMGQAGGPAEMMEFYFKMLPELLNEFAGETDSATLALTPDTNILNLDIALRAKDNSELSEMLVATKYEEDFRLADYLDNANAVNGLMRMDGSSMQDFYDKLFDIMEAATDDPATIEETAKMKGLVQKMFAAMGNEVSISYSYAAGTPPFKLQEVFEVKDGAAMKVLTKEGVAYANVLYKTMGIPAELKYESAVSTYKSATIDAMSISITASDDPNDMTYKEIEKIYGSDGFKYYFAQTKDKFYLAMGPNSEDTLKALIDQPPSTAAPSGDIKIAMDALESTPYDDFIMSVNVIKLIKGMGEMIEALGAQPGMEPAAAMFNDMKDLPTKSCLVVGGNIGDGLATLRLAVPKQHLIEIVGMGMQIQQQAMAATDQKLTEVQQNREEVKQIEQQIMVTQKSLETQQENKEVMEKAIQEKMQNSPHSWVGKPAPELKMVDLDGEIHHISQLKGKKILLDFWASWCPPCKKSIPDLIKLASSGNSDLVILGLSDESSEKLTSFSKEAKINYPIVAYQGKLPAPYGQVTGIPTLFIIDSKGIIQDVLVGYHELRIIQSRLKEME
jgi:thiol-disulfide isomerase/thioredoxin